MLNSLKIILNNDKERACSFLLIVVSNCSWHENGILRKHHNKDQITCSVYLFPSKQDRTRHVHCLICFERITQPNKPIDENFQNACISFMFKWYFLKIPLPLLWALWKNPSNKKQAQLNEYLMKWRTLFPSAQLENLPLSTLLSTKRRREEADNKIIVFLRW